MLVCLVQHVGAAGYYTEAHELHHRKMRMKNAYYPGILAAFFLKCYRGMRPDTLPDSVRIEFEEREVEIQGVPGGTATKLCIDIWDLYRLAEFWGIPLEYGSSRLTATLRVMQQNGFGLFKTAPWFQAKSTIRERLIRNNTGPDNKVTFFAYELTAMSQFEDFLKFKCWSHTTSLGHLHYKAVIAMAPQPFTLLAIHHIQVLQRLQGLSNHEEAIKMLQTTFTAYAGDLWMPLLRAVLE